MADSTTSSAVSGGQDTPSFAVQSAQIQLSQIIGKLVQNTGTQSNSLVAALNSIASAINAKPSA